MIITCVHQGFELYGSDRSFIESVSAIRSKYPTAEIIVILPTHGPIVEYLKKDATRVVFEPLWILRRRSILRLATFEIGRFPAAFARACRRLSTSDLVYINTSVVIDYALAARFFPNKAISHIHEIPEGLATKALSAILRWSRAELIFNSNATKSVFRRLAGMRSHVIYNGVAGPALAEPVTYDAERPLRVLMLGRINRIKGQEVLLDAIAALPSTMKDRIVVRMVGSSFETDALEIRLKERVVEMGLTDRVSVLPFVPDPEEHYRWSDIVVVPSRRPESLGRVAIEAMAYGRPPLVSAIGGLVEVVDDNRTGWLVPPGDAGALSAKLQSIISAPETWRDFAPAARHRYQHLFSKDAVAAAIATVIEAKLERNAVSASTNGKAVKTP